MSRDLKGVYMKRLLLTFVLLWPAILLAELRAGMDAFNGGDYAAAHREWLPVAEQGNHLIQTMLGVMYFNGWGVPRDEAGAVNWFRRAAEQRNAFAQHSLGVVYSNGWGVPRNDLEAAKWFRLAAEQGHADAQTFLGASSESA